MSGQGEDDPFDLSLSPEEMRCTAEEFSLLLVQDGLQRGDLSPLAEHLRKDRPFPPTMAAMIADAIEGKPGSVCRISASRPNAGNPHEGNGDLHTRYVEIGSAYLRDLQDTKYGGAKELKHKIAKRFHVSESTVRNAVSHTRRWLSGLAD
jgi:hypothetical protein